MYYHYHCGLPLTPSTLRYPLLGEKSLINKIKFFVDAVCILAILIGSIASVGFLALLADNGAYYLTQSTSIMNEVLAIIGMGGMVLIISFLGYFDLVSTVSRLAILLTLFVLFYVIVFGSTHFIIASFIGGMKEYVMNFIDMSIERDGVHFFGFHDWLSWWTIFFWGWWVSLVPVKARFIARISKGRSIREVILATTIIAPLITNIYFAILGGASLDLEVNNPGMVSSLFDQFQIMGALFVTLMHLPKGTIISLVTFVTIMFYTVVALYSSSYSMSITIAKNPTTIQWVERLLIVSVCLMSIVLIVLGSGGMTKLQNVIVISAVLFLLLFFLLYGHLYIL